MGFRFRSTDDLVRIAAAGGGFTLNARHRSTDDLIRIAAAAGHLGARVTLQGLRHRTTDELVRIGAASKGAVVLED